MINLDQSKAFDRVDHGFLKAVLSASGFGMNFHCWNRFLNAFPEVMVEVNGVRSKPCCLDQFVKVFSSRPYCPSLGKNLSFACSVGWGVGVCRMHRLHFDRGVILHQRVSRIKTKQSEEAPVMLEL